MWHSKSAIEFQNCGLLSSGRQFPPSWRWAQVLCTGSVGSTPSPSASAVPRPLTDCTLDTYAPGGSVYKRDGQAMCFKGKEKTTILTDREKTVLHFKTTYREKDIWPGSSRRPKHGHWCPELCLVADLPAPWLCSLQRVTAQSLQCPASQTAQRSRPGRWRVSGWTRRTRADHRKHVSKLWPRRSHSAWSDTLGSYIGVCRRRETWLWLWKEQ